MLKKKKEKKVNQQRSIHTQTYGPTDRKPHTVCLWTAGRSRSSRRAPSLHNTRLSSASVTPQALVVDASQHSQLMMSSFIFPCEALIIVRVRVCGMATTEQSLWTVQARVLVLGSNCEEICCVALCCWSCS